MASSAAMRARRLLLILGLAVTVPAAPRPVAAQSAAELEAARELFKQGTDLEKKKEYAAALEKFRRVAEIKSTAIVRYHEGFCSEKLGKWVEAIDAWSRAQVDGQGDGKQKDAVEASRKAADALRPRVPRIRLKVAGPLKSKAQVTIDGAPISPVLFDSGIPVDVGAHTVELGGAGVAPDKQEVTVVEKETKEVAFDAKEPAAVAVPVTTDKEPSPAVEPAPPKTGKPAATMTTTTASSPSSADEPTSPHGAWIAPKFGLIFGLSLQTITPGGQIHGTDATKTNYFIVPTDGGASADATQWMKSGVAPELTAGLRVAPAVAAYVFWHHGFLGAGDHSNTLDNFLAQTDAVGLGAMLDTNPRGHLGFYADVAVLQRWTKTRQNATETTLTAIEPRLKVGVAYKPSARFTLLGYVWASAGQYKHLDYVSSKGGTQSIDIDSTATHTFGGLGLSLVYDLPLGKQ